MTAERAPLRAALAVGLVAGPTLARDVRLQAGAFSAATLLAAACSAAAAAHARLGRWP
jgi:hypothetical protein